MAYSELPVHEQFTIEQLTHLIHGLLNIIYSLPVKSECRESCGLHRFSNCLEQLDTLPKYISMANSALALRWDYFAQLAPEIPKRLNTLLAQNPHSIVAVRPGISLYGITAGGHDALPG